MAKAIAVYQSYNNEKHTMMIALGADGNTYSREFKRHSRFGNKWSGWALTDFNSFVNMGFENFKRVDKAVKVVLP